MRFCNKKIQKHLLKGGKIERTKVSWFEMNGKKFYGFDYKQAIYLDECLKTCKSEEAYEDDEYCLTDDDLTAEDWKIIK